jgi:hypothetical protein
MPELPLRCVQSLEGFCYSIIVQMSPFESLVRLLGRGGPLPAPTSEIAAVFARESAS